MSILDADAPMSNHEMTNHAHHTHHVAARVTQTSNSNVNNETIVRIGQELHQVIRPSEADFFESLCKMHCLRRDCIFLAWQTQLAELYLTAGNFADEPSQSSAAGAFRRPRGCIQSDCCYAHAGEARVHVSRSSVLVTVDPCVAELLLAWHATRKLGAGSALIPCILSITM